MNDTDQSRLGPLLMDSVLVLRLLYYHHGAVRMMRTVVTHASENSSFNCSIAMASDNQHLRLMPLNRLTKNIPGIPFQHFKQSITHLGAELPGLLDDAHGALLQVRLHERQHIRRAWSGEADGGGGGGLGVDDDEAVLRRLAGGGGGALDSMSRHMYHAPTER